MLVRLDWKIPNKGAQISQSSYPERAYKPFRRAWTWMHLEGLPYQKNPGMEPSNIFLRKITTNTELATGNKLPSIYQKASSLRLMKKKYPTRYAASHQQMGKNISWQVQVKNIKRKSSAGKTFILYQKGTSCGFEISLWLSLKRKVFTQR